MFDDTSFFVLFLLLWVRRPGPLPSHRQQPMPPDAPAAHQFLEHHGPQGTNWTCPMTVTPGGGGTPMGSPGRGTMGLETAMEQSSTEGGVAGAAMQAQTSGFRGSRKVRTQDGRTLMVERLGGSESTVFLLTGTGSGWDPAPRGMVLYQRGMQLIAYDVPGPHTPRDRLKGAAIAADAKEVARIEDCDGAGESSRWWAAPAAPPGGPVRRCCPTAYQEAGWWRWRRGTRRDSTGSRDGDAQRHGVHHRTDDPKEIAAADRGRRDREEPHTAVETDARDLTHLGTAGSLDALVRSMLPAKLPARDAHFAYGWIEDAPLASARPGASTGGHPGPR